MYPIICEHCGRFHRLNKHKLQYTNKVNRGRLCRRHCSQLESYGYFIDDKQVFRKIPNKNKYKIFNGYVEFELYDSYGNIKDIGFIDIDDLHYIIDYKWYILRGYAHNDKLGDLHKILCKGDLVDHINRNKLDNRRENLRQATYSDNNSNMGLRSTNTSGIIGVSYNKRYSKWCTRLEKDNILHREYFDNFEDAVRQRLIWEKEVLGDYAPQKHLFKKYNID